MQIRRIWGFQETHETRTPKHSKSEEGRPLSCQALVRTAGGFFVLSTVHIGAYAYFVPQEKGDIVTSLPYLSAYLGHYDMGATQIYLRLISECYPELIRKQCDYLGDTIPKWEIQHEKE